MLLRRHGTEYNVLTLVMTQRRWHMRANQIERQRKGKIYGRDLGSDLLFGYASRGSCIINNLRSFALHPFASLVELLSACPLVSQLAFPASAFRPVK